MSDIITDSRFILKRQGLAIGGKYHLFDQEGKQEILFIEEKTKWIPPSTTIHAYSDDKRKVEVLTMKDRPDGGVDEYDVFDATTSQKIGAFVTDVNSVSEFFKDVWALLDAQDNPVGKVYEPNLAKSLARSLLTHDIAQHVEVKIGEIDVAEIQQKIKPMSYELVLDFNKDVSNLLDHRIGIAAGILLALHQGRETD